MYRGPSPGGATVYYKYALEVCAFGFFRDYFATRGRERLEARGSDAGQKN
jgi:hypothetical protein